MGGSRAGDWNMNASLYQSIVCQLTQAYSLYTNSANSLTQMQNDLSLIDVDDSQKSVLSEEIELCKDTLTSDSLSFKNQIIAVVQAMNINVLRSNPDVNAFLTTNSVRIPTTLANLVSALFVYSTSLIVDDETACNSF
jgi:hypothetical protein